MRAQEALLQALATTVRDGALPVAGAALWAGHVLPGRRAGTTLDLRASSHRKLSKLLQARPVLPLQGPRTSASVWNLMLQIRAC